MQKPILTFCLICIIAASAFAQTPQIVATTPSQNELNAAVATDISVTFDIDMDASTINDSTFLVNAMTTGLHAGTITYDAPSKTATFNPAIDFAKGEIATVVLTDGIEPSAGAPLVDYAWSFTTVADDGSGVFAAQATYTAGNLPASVFAADLDGDCNVIGGDVTRLVNYFRGSATVVYCAGYEPLWFGPGDLTGEAPSGWPNCELATVAKQQLL